ncbi:hypothetical protein [Marinibacterium sp. SX1]|uniref:hypothetical protein n=1 Tax=Marinibacterium sp. SX1 TaxID=3388424 RepID=UPI003D162962
MTEPAILARRIATTIGRSRIDVTTEAAAHRAISSALASAGIEHTNEARLTPSERIDILAGTVGVEIKVKHSRRDIWRQLERYAALPEIEALVLATGTAFPDITEVGGKPLVIADLSKGWL